MNTNVSKKLTIALVGYGYWGPNHARILSSMKNINLKWICDLDNKLLRKAKRAYPNVSITNRAQQIVDDLAVDAVIIATPIVTHEKLISYFITRNMHVFVEKPLVTSSKVAQALFNQSKKHGVRLMEGLTYLFNPATNYLETAIKRGDLGKILFIISQRSGGIIQKDVNVMWDLAPHDISIINFITKSKVVSVAASGQGFFYKDKEDIVSINMILNNNTFANVIVNQLTPLKIRQTTIVGDKKMAVFDDSTGYPMLRVYSKKLYPFTKGKKFSYSKLKQIFMQKGKVETIVLPSVEPLKAELSHFVKIVLDKREKCIVTSSHSIEIIKVLEAATKSLNKDRLINVS